MHELKATEDLEAATLVGIIPGWGTPAPSPLSSRGRPLSEEVRMMSDNTRIERLRKGLRDIRDLSETEWDCAPEIYQIAVETLSLTE